MPVLGAFQVENALVLYPLARIMGFDIQKIAPLLQKTLPETGRSGMFHGKFGATIVDGTYN